VNIIEKEDALGTRLQAKYSAMESQALDLFHVVCIASVFAFRAREDCHASEALQRRVREMSLPALRARCVHAQAPCHVARVAPVSRCRFVQVFATHASHFRGYRCVLGHHRLL
jgi:hypothetical protein